LAEALIHIGTYLLGFCPMPGENEYAGICIYVPMFVCLYVYMYAHMLYVEEYVQSIRKMDNGHIGESHISNYG
jgi:hypothetical protein